ELDLLVTPVGGGGLLSGCATAARHLSPRCAIFGVEPEAGNDAQRSLAQGEIVRIATPQTIADAAQSRSLGQHTFPVLQQLMDGIVTASDAVLIDAMRFFATRIKIITEPTCGLVASRGTEGFFIFVSNNAASDDAQLEAGEEQGRLCLAQQANDQREGMLLASSGALPTSWLADAIPAALLQRALARASGGMAS